MIRGIWFSLCLALLSSPSLAANQPVYSVDFSGYSGGPVLAWLGTKGFLPKQDAANSSKVVFSVVNDKLVLEAKRNALALLIKDGDMTGVERVRIEWGVDAYPPGASYDKGVRSDAIMLYVFFGRKKVSSGSMFVPDSPYFLGLFLCDQGRIGHPYTGRYFKAGGRYICISHAKIGEPLVSEFNLSKAFKEYFKQGQVPDISGYALSIDTDPAKGKATAKSFVRKVEFLK